MRWQVERELTNNLVRVLELKGPEGVVPEAEGQVGLLLRGVLYCTIVKDSLVPLILRRRSAQHSRELLSGIFVSAAQVACT